MKSIRTFINFLPVLVLTGSFASAAERTSRYDGPWDGWHSHWPGFWWICPLIFLIMIVVFGVLFIGTRHRRFGGWAPWRWMNGQPEGREFLEGLRDATSETAIDILNKRYARGEIDRAEYDEKKAAILSAEN